MYLHLLSCMIAVERDRCARSSRMPPCKMGGGELACAAGAAVCVHAPSVVVIVHDRVSNVKLVTEDKQEHTGMTHQWYQDLASR